MIVAPSLKSEGVNYGEGNRCLRRAESASETPPTRGAAAQKGYRLQSPVRGQLFGDCRDGWLFAAAGEDGFVVGEHVRTHRGQHQADGQPDPPIFVRRPLGVGLMVVMAVVRVILVIVRHTCLVDWR